MMGPAHSLSGAAAWLGVGAAAAAAGHPMPWPVLVVGALICAGAALAPDLDHKAATISRAFGPISRGPVRGRRQALVRRLQGDQEAGRPAQDRRPPHAHPHLAVGGPDRRAAPRRSAITGGRWAVLAILFVHLVLAVEGLLWRAARVSSDVLVWLLGATSAWILAGVLDKPGNGSDWLFTAPGQEYLWLGLPIVLGALVHDIGDALTVSGCPILWPIPIGRKRWYPIGPPKVMRFRAGSWVELKVLMPVFMLLGGVGGAAALGYI